MEAIMKDEPENVGWPAAGAAGIPRVAVVVDRATWQAELDALRVREKAHTREGDAIAAARQRLPMVEVDPAGARAPPRRRRWRGWRGSTPATAVNAGGAAAPRSARL